MPAGERKAIRVSQKARALDPHPKGVQHLNQVRPKIV